MFSTLHVYNQPPLPLSYLEHQYQQQQRRHDCVHLTLLGQRVEICEGVPRLLHIQRPLLLGHGAAAQVQPAHRSCQSQFTETQDSPGGQQVAVALSEEAQDPPHQEVQHQGKENDLETRNHKVSLQMCRFTMPKTRRIQQGCSGSFEVNIISSFTVVIYFEFCKCLSACMYVCGT